MDEKLDQFALYCSTLDFGHVDIKAEEKEFLAKVNNEIILLCKSLPKLIQTDALLFFMIYYGIKLGQNLNFFKNYYAPTWSIIYWLGQTARECKRIGNEDMKLAITAHAMAMVLHSLDDHLNDGEVRSSHLALLLRSQSWLAMNDALNQLAAGVTDGHETIQRLLDDYYFGIRSSEEIESLDAYCSLFRKQMAIGLIVPVLLLKKMELDNNIINRVVESYGSFGIAWRLLDDINDIQIDMEKGIKSSVYIFLPENMKSIWLKNNKNKSNVEISDYEEILECLIMNEIINKIKKRICLELNSSEFIASECNMAELACEFRSLLKPLENQQDYL